MEPRTISSMALPSRRGEQFGYTHENEQNDTNQVSFAFQPEEPGQVLSTENKWYPFLSSVSEIRYLLMCTGFYHKDIPHAGGMS